MKVGLCIGGSDSSAASGIQADIKTFAALEQYACSVITAIVAENTQKVLAIYPLPWEIIQEQLKSIEEDFSIGVIKISMVYHQPIIEGLLSWLQDKKIPVVIDPIVVSTTNATLLKKSSRPALLELLRLATLITPNWKEAEWLIGKKEKEPQRLLEQLQRLVPQSHILLKTGDKATDPITDYLYFQGEMYCLTHERIAVDAVRGTGCTLAAAIAAFLLQGFSILDACKKAQEYLLNTLVFHRHYGKGAAVLMHCLCDTCF